MEELDELKYLGSILCKNESMNEKIQKKTSQVRKVMFVNNLITRPFQAD